MSGPVVRDETGLHAVECECLSCEAGFRPSPMQRHYAAEALAQRKLRDEALQGRKPSREELRRAERRRLHSEAAERRTAEEREWRRRNPPLTQDQIQELEEAKRREFPALAGGSRR
jgi:Na+-translocating ferredoxin:NAD+ oxidoreductase RnfC subunit